MDPDGPIERMQAFINELALRTDSFDVLLEYMDAFTHPDANQDGISCIVAMAQDEEEESSFHAFRRRWSSCWRITSCHVTICCVMTSTCHCSAVAYQGEKAENQLVY